MPKGKGLNSLIPEKNEEGSDSISSPSTDNRGQVEVSQENENQVENSLDIDLEDEGEIDFDEDNGIEEIEDDEGQAVFQIEVEKINPNPYQPRKNYDEEGMEELADSIREVGIIQPLVVSKVEEEVEGGTKVEYQLISGERRLRAAKRVGLERVPAVVRAEAEGRDKLSMALVENIQRSDLNPIETARAYARLQEEFDLTQREIASKVGKSRSTVANTLRLLKLPSEIKSAVASEKINESQARLLLSIDDPQEQSRSFEKLINDELSTSDLKSRTRKKTKQRDPSSSSSSSNKSSREERFWEDQLEEKFSAPVEISRSGEGGEIVIKFFSGEEWRSILDKLLEDGEI